MLISYQSQLLQEICFQSSLAIQHLGEAAAVCLQARHSDIQAARNVFELLVGQVTVEGNLCKLTVPDILSIVMAPNYGAGVSGTLYDWSTVGRIKVMGSTMLDEGMMEKPDWVSPPGHTIVSILEQRELSVEQFADQIGRSPTVAQKILDGIQAIDVDVARALSRSLGASESFWIAREHDYRASISPPEQVRIASLSDLLDKLPVSDMRKFGWIQKAQSREDQIAECLGFFGVSSLAQWQGRYESAFHQAAYRRSTAYASCEVATTAWLRQGEIETQDDEVENWSPAMLEKQLPHFRRLTWYKSPDLFLPKLKEAFAKAGVKFTIVRAPKGCAASGAVRILADDTPHMQLSFRYLSDDQFWFSLFHEIAHLLLHYDKMPILENTELTESACELEANEYASQAIVPVHHHEELLSLGSSRFPIIAFSKKIGIAPGLVVGQLQHHGILRFNQMHHLKRRFCWSN